MCDCNDKQVSKNTLFTTSLAIPDQIRPDVAEVVDRTRRTLAFTRPDIEYLFKVYNRYIAKAAQPEDVNCGGCRTAVVKKMRAMVDEWRRTGYLDA